MNGEFAALVALAAHGSRWLATLGTEPRPELVGSNSCFQYVRVLDVDLGRSRVPGRGGTADWLSALRRAGADTLVVVAQRRTWGLFANGSPERERCSTTRIPCPRTTGTSSRTAARFGSGSWLRRPCRRGCSGAWGRRQLIDERIS